MGTYLMGIPLHSCRPGRMKVPSILLLFLFSHSEWGPLRTSATPVGPLGEFGVPGLYCGVPGPYWEVLE